MKRRPDRRLVAVELDRSLDAGMPSLDSRMVRAVYTILPCRTGASGS